MKSIQLIVQLAFGVGLLLATILPAYPHGGGLDSMAATTIARPVVITVIEGPLAGQSFAS
jgi:hypothetical protein